MGLKDIGILILILAIVALGYYALKKPKVVTETIIEKVTDTIVSIKPVPCTTYVTKTITKEIPIEKVIIKDSIVYVNLEKEVKEYRDTNYYAKVSGIDPNLDYIETYNTTTTITNTTTIYKKPLITFGVGVTAGYSPIYNKFDAVVGVTATIPIYSIYR